LEDLGHKCYYEQMSNKERPLQRDMFTGELVDNRTRTQKKHDSEREKPKQPLLFPQREIAQFGVNPHPQFPLSPNMMLRLIVEDRRTPEEKERAVQRQSEEKMGNFLDRGDNFNDEIS
jgi:hypothetical protein